MLWIKRNMFLAVGGLITLLVLGGGGFLLFGSIQKNKAVEEQAESVIATRNRLYNMKPFPASSNVVAAQAQLGEMQGAIDRCEQFFEPVPFQSVSNLEFKTLLDNTVATLQQRAQAANTILPTGPGYAFSFIAEKEALSLPPASFPTVPMQLAEVAVLANILFDAKINALASLRRPRVTGYEPGQEDFHGLLPVTNLTTKTVSTPYEISFLGFSTQLARILESCYESKYGIEVKAVASVPTGGLPADFGSPATSPYGPSSSSPYSRYSAPPQGRYAPPQGRYAPPAQSRYAANPYEQRSNPYNNLRNRSAIQDRYRANPYQAVRGFEEEGRYAVPTAPATGIAPVARPSGPQTVLDENLLKIDLLIYMIRPLPEPETPRPAQTL